MEFEACLKLSAKLARLGTVEGLGQAKVIIDKIVATYGNEMGEWQRFVN